VSLPVIAIDGTAASGKGTIAKALAQHFRFDHLDTGALYRAVAALVLQAGGDPASRDDAIEAAGRFRPGIVPDAELRTDKIGEASSIVSAIPEVRSALRAFQLAMAAEPPGGRGVVIDGRDIGTVICPTAPVKLFVTAAVEERARRRWRELQGYGIPKSYDQILDELKARDLRDSTRLASPLKAAPDAVLLDTTDLSIDAAVAAALGLARGKLEA
jgi:cytidylate kinase